MSDLREAAKLALIALENGTSPNLWLSTKENLRKALAQPEQRGHCTCGDPEALGVVHFRTRPCFHYTEPLAQPEQEPVAWMNNDYEVFFDAGKAACYSMGWIKPLYTAPPKREWVGLTDEQFLEACQLIERGNYLVALRQVQAKLKEKNNG